MLALKIYQKGEDPVLVQPATTDRCERHYTMAVRVASTLYYTELNSTQPSHSLISL
jgi:hypothetical protein